MKEAKSDFLNFENEKYKDLLAKISHKNKGLEYDLKKRAIQLIKFQ